MSGVLISSRISGSEQMRTIVAHSTGDVGRAQRPRHLLHLHRHLFAVRDCPLGSQLGRGGLGRRGDQPLGHGSVGADGTALHASVG